VSIRVSEHACYNLRVAGPAPKRAYSRDEVCRLSGIKEPALADWEKRGFVDPLASYSFPDLIALKTLAQLRRSRVRPERIHRMLDSLRDKLGNANPLTELKIFTDGRRVSVQVGRQRMEPISGQLLLDFDREEITRLLEFPQQPAENEAAREAARTHAEADRWFEKGLDLEQSGAPMEQVVTAYLRAVALEPKMAAAHVNLGTVYFHAKKWTESERHYLLATEAAPEYALAHFNLGNLYDELNDSVRALAQYVIALRLNPTYSDAHYNVALLYQGRGDNLNALRHWRTYLKLDPSGYWAGIARRELAKLRSQTVLSGTSK
jgi:tetratricopeptide (TPR) repeat protein